MRHLPHNDIGPNHYLLRSAGPFARTKNITDKGTCEVAVRDCTVAQICLWGEASEPVIAVGATGGYLSPRGPSLWRQPSALPFGTSLGSRIEVAERSAPIRITRLARQFRMRKNGDGKVVNGSRRLSRCRPRKVYGLPTAPLPHPAPLLSEAPPERLYCSQSSSRRQWSSHL